MFRILIVEDDQTIREELAALLQSCGYETAVLAGFDDPAGQVAALSPHLVLLDIGLPGVDGFEACTQIRAASTVPILFVTSRSSDLDELKSISLGGDDFITKPYHTAILLARIAALLKRAYPAQAPSDTVACRGVTLNLAAGFAEHDGRRVELSKNELRILAYLFAHPGRIVSRTDLIEHLWDNEQFVDDNTLSVNITRIRARLAEIGVRDLIQTKRGMGYLL